MALEWISPDEGLLVTLVELDSAGSETPIYQTDLVVEGTIDSNFGVLDPPIYYKLIAGEIAEYYKLIQSETNVGQLQIIPIVRELDEYVDEYAEPPGFTYDGDEKAGENYATYGSALSGGKTLTFTIRAYDATNLSTYLDSNGDLQYNDEDSNLLMADFVDREFSIAIINNWSSDRDKFVKDYYENQRLLYNNTDELTAEEWIIQQKEDGYYD